MDSIDDKIADELSDKISKDAEYLNCKQAELFVLRNLGLNNAKKYFRLTNMNPCSCDIDHLRAEYVMLGKRFEFIKRIETFNKNIIETLWHTPYVIVRAEKQDTLELLFPFYGHVPEGLPYDKYTIQGLKIGSTLESTISAVEDIPSRVADANVKKMLESENLVPGNVALCIAKTYPGDEDKIFWPLPKDKCYETFGKIFNAFQPKYAGESTNSLITERQNDGE